MATVSREEQDSLNWPALEQGGLTFSDRDLFWSISFLCAHPLNLVTSESRAVPSSC